MQIITLTHSHKHKLCSGLAYHAHELRSILTPNFLNGKNLPTNILCTAFFCNRLPLLAAFLSQIMGYFRRVMKSSLTFDSDFQKSILFPHV